MKIGFFLDTYHKDVLSDTIISLGVDNPEKLTYLEHCLCYEGGGGSK